MLLDINYNEDTTYTNGIIQLMISVSRCVFHNNSCINVYQINYGKYFACCKKDDAVLLILTDLVFTENNVFSLLHGKCVSAYIEKTIISNCIAQLSVITVLSGKMTFHKYNEVSSTSAVTAITAEKIVLKEKVSLNFSFNNFTNVFVSKFYYENIIYEQPHNLAFQTIEKCLLQYTSTQGNLDFEFQSGMSLNYSIKFYKNNISQFNDDRMTHCSWEVRTAFLTSIPLHVMKKIIHFSDNQFEKMSMVALKRALCICYNKQSMCNLRRNRSIFSRTVGNI